MLSTSSASGNSVLGDWGSFSLLVDLEGDIKLDLSNGQFDGSLGKFVSKNTATGIYQFGGGDYCHNKEGGAGGRTSEGNNMGRVFIIKMKTVNTVYHQVFCTFKMSKIA